MKKRVIAIIPARYASTRFPGKMLATIMGKSVIQRTYESAKACRLLDDLLIATDHELIYNHVTSFGGKAVMTDPNCPTGSDRLIEVLQNYPELTDAECILNVQGDEACIDPNIMDAVSSAIINNPDEVMATACVKITDPAEIHCPSVVKCVMDRNGHALYFSRLAIPGVMPKGGHAPAYNRHIGIYAFRRDFLLQYGQLPQTPLQLTEGLEQLRVLEFGYKIKVVPVGHSSPAVDIPEDIQRVTEWLCKQNSFS